MTNNDQLPHEFEKLIDEVNSIVEDLRKYQGETLSAGLLARLSGPLNNVVNRYLADTRDNAKQPQRKANER